MYKKLNKIMASLLVFVMLMANMSAVGIHLGEVIAAESGLNSQNSKTNNKNVEFDSYFIDGANKTHETTKKIGEENKIVAKISVKNAGYLKNARIDFVDSNFIVSSKTDSTKVSKIEKNTITLNQIDANENVIVELPFTFEHEDRINLNQFNKVSKAKLIATYVDEKGKEHNINKDIELGLKWTAEVEDEITAQVTKYIPYNIDNQKGLLLQMIVKEAVKDNILPIKESNIEILIPQINGQKPATVKVNSIENIDYKVNQENTKLVINTKNEVDNENTISWSNNNREYEITYVYPETAISNITELDVNIDSKLTLYSYDDKAIDKKYENKIALVEKIGEIVDLRVNSNDRLSKGYMYANYDVEEKQETVFTQKITANISMSELVNKIIIDLNIDKFTYENVSMSANTYYKNLKVNKSEILKYFGEEGKLEIYSNGKLVNLIDTNTEDEQIDVNLNLNNLTIVTTKPIKEGNFTIEFDKAINKEDLYSISEIEKIKILKTSVSAKIESIESVISEKEYNTEIKLEEPVLETELRLDNTNLSTILVNENVELRAVLKTNSEYNKLFKNPTIVFTLPEYLEEINIKNVQLLFEDELKIKEYRLEGKQIIVDLEGKQTKYSLDSIYGGANLVITLDLKLNNLTPNTQGVVNMKTISNGEKLSNDVQVNFIAPSGVVTVNKISNYSEGKELMALTQDEIATLEVKAGAKNATEEIQVINNYDNKIENVEILGRTLSTDTSNTATGEKLENTLNVPMTSAINKNGQENVNIYYSLNGNASKDLNNEENGWIAESQVTDYSNVKSYLIVLDKNYAMQKGEEVKFSYDMQIPENLNYSQKTSSLYTVFFNNVQEDQTVEDKVTSRLGTLTTGNAPELQISLNSNIEENSVVREGQIIKYAATVKNIGDVDAKNVRLSVTAPSIEGKYETKFARLDSENFTDVYVIDNSQDATINIGNIEKGKEAKVEFELKITNVNENITEKINLEMTASVIADEMQKQVNSNTYQLTVEDGDFTVLIYTEKVPEYVYTEGEELTYVTKVIQNDNDKTFNNVVVRVQIPKGLEIQNTRVENIVSSDEELQVTNRIDNNNNIVEFTIAEFEPGGEIECYVVTKVGNALGIVSPSATVISNNKEHKSNVYSNKIEKLAFEITQKRLDNSYVKETDKVTFEYTIKNLSGVYCDDFTLENIVPNGMSAYETEVVINGTSIKNREDGKDKIRVEQTIEPNETIIVKITLNADLLPKGTTQKEVTNYATISGSKFETVKSNEVNIVIEYNANAFRGYDVTDDNPVPSGDVDPQDPATQKIISGIAWIDDNKDGERNDNEKLLEGIEVRLLNKSNKILKTTKTLNNGSYSFEGLSKGEYLVVFLYDRTIYKLTEFNKTGISQSTNSDVIDVTMKIDGQDRIVAIADSIKITDSNARNIDIGMYERDKSDLRLDKYISAITLTYGKTLKTYEFNNSKLAKVEIPANSLSNATVVVEYKIVVKNEGAVTNYVKKIVDYIPKDMKFNSELNKDWYQSSNGDLYNSSLANIALKPGESKEVTLTLTKKMTSDNTGIVNNNAELYEVYNEEGIGDCDSTPANKVSGEDDLSAADIVIGVKTGDAVVYTAIISIIICLTIATSVYFIRKSILRRI